MLPQAPYPPCSWSVDGEGCRYPGTMTTTTVGGPGTQWFCSLHFGLTDLVRGSEMVRASRDYVHQAPGVSAEQLGRDAADYCHTRSLFRVDDMRKFVRTKAHQRTPPSSAWAQKIQDRVDDGEQLSLISITLAEQVLQAGHRASSAAKAAGEDGRASTSAAEAVETVEVVGGDFDGGVASAEF